VQPPSRPQRQNAPHAQRTLTLTGAPVESVPEAVPLNVTSVCDVKFADPLKFVNVAVVRSCEYRFDDELTDFARTKGEFLRFVFARNRCVCNSLHKVCNNYEYAATYVHYRTGS